MTSLASIVRPARTGVGVIVPYDMALDRELWRWTPADVDLSVTRTPFRPLEVTVEMARAVGALGDLTRSVVDLAAVSPASYAYGCASASFVDGIAGERRLVAAMMSAGARFAVSASGAMLAAVRVLGAHRVAVATPYTADLTAALAVFLTEAGIDVVASGESDLTREVWRVPAATTKALIRSVDRPSAEALLVSCTNLHTYDLIAPLEAELGKPIVTANQALIWAALKQTGTSAVGGGQRLVRY